MKLIKSGDPSKIHILYQGNCGYCGAIMEAMRSELDVNIGDEGEKELTAKCMECEEHFVEFKKVDKNGK